MLVCFNLAEEMLFPNLLEAHAGLFGAGLVDYLGWEDQNRRVAFKAADGKSPVVVSAYASDPVITCRKRCSSHDKLVGNVDYDLIYGLALGGNG